MTYSEVQELINNPTNTPDFKREVGVFLSASLHTKGVRPYNDKSNINPGYFKSEYQKDYQNIFNNYLFARHPREPEVTRQWRMSQYRPFTKAPFLMITDIIKGAIFQDGQYTLELPNQADNQYIWEKSFDGFDIAAFFANKVLKLMLEDPNGYLVRIPSKPSYETTGLVEITLKYVCIKDVISKPETGDFIFRDGKFIWWINSAVIFRFVENQQGKWVSEDARGYYAHLLGYIPANVLGGQYETEGYYTSYLDKAIPVADEYVSNFSAKQLVDKEASHPYIQQMSIPCNTCDATGQIQEQVPVTENFPTGKALVSCPTCHGRKQVSINPADRFEVPKEDMDKVAVRIINPDVSINTYHRDNVKGLMQDILDALNLTMIAQAQSGTAKAIDQEKLYQFISSISNHIFDDLLYNTLKDIIRFRNVKTSNGITTPADYEFTFVKPQQFNIKTALDLLTEISETQKAGLPLYIRRKMVAEFVDKRFSSDDVFAKKSKVIAALDPLYVYSVEEVKVLEFSADKIYFSQILPVILDEVEQEMSQKWLLESAVDAVGEKAMQIFDAKYKNVSNSQVKTEEKEAV